MPRIITHPSRLGLGLALAAILVTGILLIPDRAPVAVRKIEPPEVEPPSPAVHRSEPRTDTDTDVGTEVDLRLVGRLADGMIRIKDLRDRGVWYRCGERLTRGKQEELAAEISYRLLVEMRAVGLDVAPVGVVATMYNESGLDPCALGLGPRRWAYQEGLLDPRRSTISHTRAEVLRVVESPEARRRYETIGFDLGLCQVLTRFHDASVEEALTVSGGTRICVIEMHSRARLNRTEEPWLYWRGAKTSWYRSKIRKWARWMNGEHR